MLSNVFLAEKMKQTRTTFTQSILFVASKSKLKSFSEHSVKLPVLHQWDLCTCPKERRRKAYPALPQAGLCDGALSHCAQAWASCLMGILSDGHSDVLLC